MLTPGGVALLAVAIALGLGVTICAVLFRARARRAESRLADALAQHEAFRAEAAQGGVLRGKIENQLLEKQQRLDHLAHHDQLTGLPNRLFLAAHLPQALEAATRGGTALAILFLDLDRFKHVNDTRGHEVGDKLLQAVARRVREVVRNDDVVVRMGGDEFVVVLNGVRTVEQVNETASRINTALAAPISIDARPVVTTVSIGVSVFPRDGTDAGALLRHSDTAMYQAKERGRNNFQVWSAVIDRRLKERVAVEASLRAAMTEVQLSLHYQPIIDFERKRVVALEALLRWTHPKLGAIPPARFIPVAEESGLIVPLGDFVLQQVFADLDAWRAAGATLVPVAVNVSAGQLRRRNLAAMLSELSVRHHVPAASIQIELTEGAMFEQLESRAGESNEDAVNELRALGVRVSLDDFGTGYSSLAYLKRWRVDALKIDRSFIRDLVTDSSDLAIVGAIIAMARHLRIDVIAEGVEGFPQLETLRGLGCRLAQGFLFAEPAPADACRPWLTGRPLGVSEDAVELLPVRRVG
jgi:diguanylate cyclase (GGDEF)-like protein